MKPILFSDLVPILAAWLATYALHSTLLLGGAALLTRYLRRESWKETLWRAALVGSLLTPSLQLLLPVAPLGGRHTLTSATPTVPLGAAPTVKNAAPLSSPAQTTALDAVSPAPATTAALATPGPRKAPGLRESVASAPTSWTAMLLRGALALWALVAMAMLLRFAALQRGLVAALRRGSRPVAPETQALADALRARAGLRRRPRLAASDACASPLVLPGARVYLPAAFATALDAAEQRGALAHELAHVARRDPEWMLVAGVAGCLCWFQPLNLFARRRLRESAEYLSDAWAVEQAGSAGGLSSGLAKVATWVLQAGRPWPVGTSAMAEGGPLLVRRVERLLRERRIERPVRAGLRTAVAVVVCLVAVGAAPRVAWTGAEAAGAPTGPAGTPLASWFADTPEVIRHPDPSQPLAERWAWAAREAAQRRLRGYWVAYGIDRPARRPGEAIISDTRGFALSSLTDGSPPLGRALLGPAETNAYPHRTALLFRVADARRPDVFDAVAARTLSVSFDARRLPILWLGLAPDAESVPWLDGLASLLPTRELRAEAIDLLAFHRASDLVLPVLDRVLRTSPEPEVRAEAAEGLASHEHPRALELLDRTATEDRDVQVRREAAEALGEIRMDGALAVIDRLLGTESEAEVRAEAAEGLANHTHPDALRLLDRTIAEDPDAHVRGEAVEALGESPVPGARERLRALVRARDVDVRREAVESIAEQKQGDPLAVLTEIIDTEADPDVIDEAVESLGDLPDGTGTPTLVRLAERHANLDVRRRALETLGEALHEGGRHGDAAFATLERIALRDTDPEARRAAAEALGEGRDTRSRALLRRLMRNDPDARVREEARDALE